MIYRCTVNEQIREDSRTFHNDLDDLEILLIFKYDKVAIRLKDILKDIT
ncbi:hypothetical protein P689_122152 [Candidatus Riesia pediculischaeffi PTSU]|uniref:Uncharacterized protein n=1 Tax=Candidatus Riesia pediculischaeffi PTSU TaxID=1401651 RepID=A0A0C1V807_9ENTR|nr:hypothetical protein P689_122152 [Candidatus Riesia pediculischaeffi PTSU]